MGDTEAVIDAKAGPARAAKHPAATRPRLDVAWCAGCGCDHGMGHCPRAAQLTQEALRRQGARFNWR